LDRISLKTSQDPLGIIVKVVKVADIKDDHVKKDQDKLYYVMSNNRIYELFYFEVGEV
tara:strand:+ start:834 stop:1007 length:174 start_codon:yes stop_codon:yes gene_type:complete